MRPLSPWSRRAPAPPPTSHAIPASAPARPLSVSPKPTSIGSQPPTGLHALVSGEEALGLAGRLEALHLPLPSSGRLMRILRPVVQSFVPPMLDRGHHVCLCRVVAGELVRDHHTRHASLALQQLAKQALGGPLVPPALDENVEHDPILVDRPPEPVLLSPDHQAHFVEVPLVSRTGEPAPD